MDLAGASLVRSVLLALLFGLPLGAGGADHAVQVAAGLGYSYVAIDHKDASGRRIDGQGTGGWAEFEYAYQPVSWLTPRAYAGALLTGLQPTSCGAGIQPCEVTARIAFAGGKLRLLAPFPWVAPFVESGLGVSVGRFRTRSGAAVDRAHGGIAYHVPVGLGLLMGRQRGLELCLQYLYHPRQWVTGGALALGLGWDLE